MGLSVSAASAILFSAFVLVFGIISESLYKSQDAYMEAQKASFQRMDERTNCHITITGLDAFNGTVTVLNSGSEALNPYKLDILINGTLADGNVTSREISGKPGSNLWAPSESLIIHMNIDLTGVRVKAVAGEGVTAYYG